MFQLQWVQWAWLAVTVGGLALSGYLLMRITRLELNKIARRMLNQRILDDGMVKWVEQISHVLLLAVIVVLLILGVFLALWVAGHPAVADWSPALIVEWLVERGVRIVLLLAGSYLAIKIVNLLLSNVVLLIRPYDETPAAEIERQKRAHTLSAVLQKTAMALIIAVAILMVLAELNVNTTPILASVGVIGVALGFGAQQMVGDLLAGFFHIFENQIRVGDVAVINGTGGLVQDIRLRTTVLRGLDGTVHVFRNGSINTLSNMTKDFSYALLDLGVAYKEDTDHVCEVVREVAAGLQADEKFGPSILEPVEVIGVDNFADSAVIIRLRIKTLPIKQWDVAREFRRRIKYRFDQEGIEIPFPHRSIYFGEASKPFQVGVHDYSDRAAPPGSEGNPPAK